MITKNRLGRNMGRVEILSAQNKINSLLQAGYDRKKIHSRLIEEGAITMSYSTFCYQLNKQTPAIPVAASGAPQPPKNSSLKRADKSEPFTIDRNPNINDLV